MCLSGGVDQSAIEVVLEGIAVVGVGAVVDDLLRALAGDEATQVGDALLGDEDVDVVLGVVHVADHRARCRRSRPPWQSTGVTKIEMYALRAKSPDPPIPFWMREPITCVEFTLP